MRWLEQVRSALWSTLWRTVRKLYDTASVYICSRAPRVCIIMAYVTGAAGAFDLKREAAMALWQLCKDGRHLSSAVEAGALPLFLDLIRLPDVRAPE